MTGWVADPSIAWRILLTAELEHPLDAGAARESLRLLHDEQGWSGDGLVVEDGVAALRRELGERREPAVAVGLAGAVVVVSAHHSAVDGLGLLAVLAAVTGSPVSSSVRGVGDRADASGFAGTVVRRLGEVAFRPPAGVAGGGGDPHAAHDCYVQTTVTGTHLTADLVAAAVRGLAAHGGRPLKHAAVAVGVARDAEGSRIADRSALMRLRDAERLSRDEVAALLRTAPTQRPPSGGSGGGLMAVGLKVLAPRLGSTLLVSHLGPVTARGVRSLAFHPVTAGGSGLSLGASTLRDATTITLRGRGRSWRDNGLELLLEAVATELS